MYDSKFFIRYYLPGIAIILTLVVVSQTYMTMLTEKDLLTVTGNVTSIIQDKYKHYKYTDDRITINLDNSADSFYFFDNQLNYFADIIENVHIGDRITISHRTKLQAKLGTGSEFKIMKIQKGSMVLYGFDKAKESFRGVGKFGAFVVVGLWFGYFLLRRQLKRQKGST